MTAESTARPTRGARARTLRRSVTLAVALAAMLMGLLAAPAQAQTTTPVRMQSNTNSSYCLSVLAYGQEEGNHIVHWDCFGEPNEVFSFQYAGELEIGTIFEQLFGNTRIVPVYRIRSNWSNLCLSAEDGDTSSGTTVVQYGCNSNLSRLWVPIQRGANSYSFANANTLHGLFDNPRCLDVPGATSGRTSMQIWSCHNTQQASQTFNLT